MRAEITRRMTSEPCSLYAIDAINLIEGGGSTLCDCTIAVTSPAELRVRRIMMRDGIDEAYARMRIAAQKTDDYYREKCDYVLENAAGTPEAFQAQAKLFFEKLIEKIKEEKLHAGEE
jgi:dephospho-CoA kinase